MFLTALLDRNPALVAAATQLHREGAITPGTFVIDIEAVGANAALLADRARALGLELYFMTKQVGRNPVVARAALAHVPAAVAVDVDDADALAAAGIPLGHVGHLVQPPRAAVDRVVAYGPEVITVFSTEKARQIAAAAHSQGREQALLLRVADEGDEFFPGQEGGFALRSLAAARSEIDALAGVRVAGVTTYPVVKFERDRYVRTHNLETLSAAAALLGDLEQVNAAGHTSLDVLPLVAESGATHAEPGHALTGTTPRAVSGLTPEMPAVCFVSEVSHLDDDNIWVFGGGFYERGHAQSGLLDDGDGQRRLALRPLPTDAIDYYRRLARDGARAAVGDTAIFAFRYQAFTSRARVATVAGVASGRPSVIGIHDTYGRPLTRATADGRDGRVAPLPAAERQR